VYTSNCRNNAGKKGFSSARASFQTGIFKLMKFIVKDESSDNNGIFGGLFFCALSG